EKNGREGGGRGGQEELMGKGRNETRKMTNNGGVPKSTTGVLWSCRVKTAMSDKEAAFTPLRKAPAAGCRRMRGTSGPLIATKKNAGRKIPTVATTDPGRPPST